MIFHANANAALDAEAPGNKIKCFVSSFALASIRPTLMLKAPQWTSLCMGAILADLWAFCPSCRREISSLPLRSRFPSPPLPPSSSLSASRRPWVGLERTNSGTQVLRSTMHYEAVFDEATWALSPFFGKMWRLDDVSFRIILKFALA